MKNKTYSSLINKLLKLKKQKDEKIFYNVKDLYLLNVNQVKGLEFYNENFLICDMHFSYYIGTLTDEYKNYNEYSLITQQGVKISSFSKEFTSIGDLYVSTKNPLIFALSKPKERMSLKEIKNLENILNLIANKVYVCDENISGLNLDDQSTETDKNLNNSIDDDQFNTEE